MNNIETNKREELNQNRAQEGDKIQEINQIEHEQRLIVERMLRLNLEKERLHDLLDMLQCSDSDEEEQHA